MAAQEHGFLIAGADSARCVLASRLSEDASVLLNEAGAMEVPLNSFIPDEAPFLIGSNVGWSYTTVPQAGAAGRSLLMPHPSAPMEDPRSFEPGRKSGSGTTSASSSLKGQI